MWWTLALLASVVWGISYTVCERTLESFTPIHLIWYDSGIIFLILTVYFILFGDMGAVLKVYNHVDFWWVVFATITYTIASILVMYSISIGGAAAAGAVESCYPLFALLFARILFGYWQVGIIGFIGMLVIVLGIVLIVLDSSNRLVEVSETVVS
jgi:drug/metabolite transporter (DMT)-like permease